MMPGKEGHIPSKQSDYYDPIGDSEFERHQRLWEQAAIAYMLVTMETLHRPIEEEQGMSRAQIEANAETSRELWLKARAAYRRMMDIPQENV